MRFSTTTYTYNTMDRVATRTDPLSRAESFTYDANGNLAEVTDSKGQVTAYTYDALDRLTETTYDDTSTTSYTYDAGDRMTEIDDSIAGTITRTYDLRDRLTNETTPEGNVSYTYDAVSRRASMTVYGQTAISYGYDEGDRLTSITQGTSTVSFGYDDANRRTSLTLPNGIEVAYAYDAASQLTGLTYTLGMTTLGTLTYSYDLAGNRTAVGGTWARTNLPSALSAATYDAANQIATWGSTSFSYDANGSLTNDGAKTYTWNARNQLSGLSGGASASFQYDGLGRRRAKTIASASTGFLYDGLNAVQELSSGTPSANIVAGLGLDEWFARTDGGGTSYFLGDALGSTMALADGSGSVQTAYTYEPFGGFSTSGAGTNNPSAFTGREADGTGLSFYRARYYHPQLQRFVSEDPLGFGAGVNFFAYVGNSPLSFVDPLGLKPSPGFGPPAKRSPNGPLGARGPSAGPPPPPPPPGRRSPDGPGGPGGPSGPDRPTSNDCPGREEGWNRNPGHDRLAGRYGVPFLEPDSAIMSALEDFVPGGHATAALHDELVGQMKAAGWPDYLVNLPTIPLAHLAVREHLKQYSDPPTSGRPVRPMCHP
jgi:RHS repeat-associated protein